MSTRNHSDDLSDEELVHYITQRTRGRIIQDILGHPYQSPSFDEIDYMNPEFTDSTLREHLNGLIGQDIVDEVEAEEEEREVDLPYKFYTLSKEGREFLERFKLYVDEEEEIKKEYASVEKPEDILRKQEDAPRPPELLKESENDDDPDVALDFG